MPVRNVGGGCYQWGGHGKRYCGKGAAGKAARQGAAARANGYREGAARKKPMKRMGLKPVHRGY